MIQIKDKSNCCGCTACASICAYNAITMTPDSLGFLYPQVNAGLCVNCGLCDKICQFHDTMTRLMLVSSALNRMNSSRRAKVEELSLRLQTSL